jgi:hypothetical protein
MRKGVVKMLLNVYLCGWLVSANHNHRCGAFSSTRRPSVLPHHRHTGLTSGHCGHGVRDVAVHVEEVQLAGCA